MKIKEDEPTGINQTPFPSGEGRGEASKYIRNGILYIVRDGKLFNLTGAQVK